MAVSGLSSAPTSPPVYKTFGVRNLRIFTSSTNVMKKKEVNQSSEIVVRNNRQSDLDGHSVQGCL